MKITEYQIEKMNLNFEGFCDDIYKCEDKNPESCDQKHSFNCIVYFKDVEPLYKLTEQVLNEQVKGYESSAKFLQDAILYAQKDLDLAIQELKGGYRDIVGLRLTLTESFWNFRFLFDFLRKTVNKTWKAPRGARAAAYDMQNYLLYRVWRDLYYCQALKETAA